MKQYLALAFLIVLTFNIVHAQDVGEILFRDILKMSQYGSHPFTGNIIEDLVKFLFVPTIFIIMIIYMTVGRVFPPGHGKFRVLLAIGMYLFIITSGYYGAFAIIAGPYFFFLIFILGLLYFILGHFRGGGGPYAERGSGGGFKYGSSGNYAAAVHDVDEIKEFLRMGHLPGPAKTALMNRYKNLNRNIKTILEKGSGRLPDSITDMMNIRDEAELKLFGHVLSDNERKRYGG